MKTRLRPESEDDSLRFGVYEAKTQLPRLLERVEHGEEITITRHGQPVARLVPFREDPRPDIAETIAAIRKLRSGIRLDGVTIRELIEEGRRF